MDRLGIQNSKLSKKIAGQGGLKFRPQVRKLALKTRKLQSKFYKITKLGNWITKPNYNRLKATDIDEYLISCLFRMEFRYVDSNNN